MDDRRFRSILRSALALSLTAPGAIVIACNIPEDPSTLPLGLDPDGSAPPAARRSAEKPQKPSLGPAPGLGPARGPCAEQTSARAPVGFWPGGVVEDRYWPYGWYDTGTYVNVSEGGVDSGVWVLEPPPDVVVPTCHCSPPPPSTACTTNVMFPCGALPMDGGISAPELCQAHCPGEKDGRPLENCRAASERAGGPPYLACDYKVASTSELCACADLTSPLDAGYFGPFPCDEEPPPPGQNLPYEDCKRHCRDVPDGGGGGVLRCTADRDRRGAPRVVCSHTPVVYSGGRRPAGLVELDRAHGTPIGAWLADTCRMERASIASFELLETELVAHDAPIDLVDRARSARADEVRHGNMMESLARRFGAEEGAWAEPPVVVPPENRSLEAIALENAVEGCVHETYAALLAMWQAENASSPVLRKAMRHIAEDETRHAALAWSVADWIAVRLSDDARARVRAAQLEAAEALRGTTTPDDELVAEGLLPTAAEHFRLVGSLRTLLWEGSGG